MGRKNGYVVVKDDSSWVLYTQVAWSSAWNSFAVGRNGLLFAGSMRVSLKKVETLTDTNTNNRAHL